MYAYAHNTTPLSTSKLSPYKIVFHTHPRIPISFDLNLTRDSDQKCTSSYCSTLPAHSHYQSTDLNSFFSTLLSKPISIWLLAVESAMLEVYSTIHKHLNHKLTSSTSTFETTHQKQLPLNAYVIPKNLFTFLPNLNPYAMVHIKSSVIFLMLHMNSFLNLVKHFILTVIIFFLTTRKNPLFSLTLLITSSSPRH